MECKELWYHESITRINAERKLQNSGQDGAFLVRKSDTVAGAYVLSLHVNNFIHHYRIRMNEKGFYETDCQPNLKKMSFDSVTSVIKYLKQNTASVGLAGPLKYPISPDSGTCDDDSDTEGEDDLSSDSSDEHDETIKQCPEHLRKSLKKRYTSHHSGNKTLLMFQEVFGSLDLDHIQEKDPEFYTLLQRYVMTSAFWDIENLDDKNGGPSCLERLVEYSCRDLMKQLRLFDSKMRVLDLMVSGIAQKSGLEERLCCGAAATHPDLLDTVLPALHSCSQTSSNFNRKMGDVFSNLSKSIRVSEECMIDTTRSFEVKEGIRGKVQVSVDPRRGTVSFGKSTEYYHEQIKRLEKNHKDETKLTILFSDNKKRDIAFDDTRTREEFYQTVSQIKHIHKSDTDVNNVSVYCCTWNMGEVEPVGDVINLFDEAGDHVVGVSNISNPKLAHDIYAIGTQEAAITEKDWANQLIKALYRLHPHVKYVNIGTQSLMGIRLVVLVNSAHINRITSTESSSVKTGVGGMVGNKGAVGISFHFGATMFAFVSCHLAARLERKAKRTNMYHDICRQLHLGKKSKYASFDLPYRFHHLFWMGDLNYRLECNYDEVLAINRTRKYDNLMKYDQLRAEVADGHIFHNFYEENINFPPTYRYKRGSRADYVYVKYKPTGNVHNVPSYCDRVLSHSLPQLQRKQTGYFCNLLYKASDHAPVIATYDIGIKLQYVWARGSLDTDHSSDCTADNTLKIRFHTIQAKIKSKSSESFYLKFCSYLLDGTPVSKAAPRILADYTTELNTFPQQATLSNCDVSYWGPGDTPDLDPILPHKDYISNEHILIQVMSSGNEECYGQGVLSMKDKVRQDAVHPFRVMLTLNDEICGEIRGRVCLSTTPLSDLQPGSFSDRLTQPWGAGEQRQQTRTSDSGSDHSNTAQYTGHVTSSQPTTAQYTGHVTIQPTNDYCAGPAQRPPSQHLYENHEFDGVGRGDSGV